MPAERRLPAMLRRGPDSISPTAHYTGEVWRRAGLGAEQLGTREGRLLHALVRPIMGASRALGGDTLEDFLLARHRLIDALLAVEIEAGRVGTVLEIAAGMSPRGLRLTAAHPGLAYVEADLPAMAQRKRDALGTSGERHRVIDIDALADEGPLSLAAVGESLDRSRGLAVVTEGLLNYLPREAVEGLWERIAALAAGHPSGVYLSDIHLGSANAGAVQKAFSAALGVFVRGRIHMHFADEADAEAALGAAGFPAVTLHRGDDASDARGAARVHVIEARA